MSVEHFPVDPIAEAAEELVSTRMETMVLPAVSLNMFYDLLQKTGDYDSDNGLSGTLQNHRPTSSDIGGFYITDSHGLPVIFKFVAEIGVSTEYNKLDPYYNIFRRPGSPIPLEALKRAHASLFLKPVSVPEESSPAESEIYDFHQKRMKGIIDFAQVALDKFVDDNKARDEDMFPELCQAQGVPLKSWIVASTDSWGLHVKSKNLFDNVPVSQTPADLRIFHPVSFFRLLRVFLMCFDSSTT
ncbi:hypothetical protein EV361DRAFT_488358 [Lentinula raphanica]|nr:hypothetical protein EV361DRAFT_488358 [Lentinula raphanica]